MQGKLAVEAVKASAQAAGLSGLCALRCVVRLAAAESKVPLWDVQVAKGLGLQVFSGSGANRMSASAGKQSDSSLTALLVRFIA